MSVLVLDTHVWVWSVEGDVRRIGRRARRLDATFLTRDTPILDYASKTGHVHDAGV